MHRITVKDFPHLDFGDKRRDQRFVTLIENISGQPGASIPRQSSGWYQTKAAYNFFKNEAVTVEQLQKTIAAYGSSLVKDLSRILVLHDISNISFHGLEAEGLGYLDHEKGRGILCYSSIAASTEGLPLCLMYQHTWTRPLEELGKAKHRKGKPFEEKESYRWYQGITEVNNSIGNEVQKVHIADRQADIYELFFSAYESQTDLLIRAFVNRRLSDGSPLWQNIAQQDIKGTVQLEIPDVTGKKKQLVEASVRYEKVEILRPATSKDKYESIELTAIEVVQTGKIKDEQERIVWRLLTTLEVSNIDDVLQYIKWYTYRWLIERFHYVLKSGTKIEQLQLKQAKSLQKAISVYSLAAIRVMQLVYQSRHSPQVSCEVALTKAQWQALYIIINKTRQLPKEPPNLHQAVKWIATLGGYLGRKSDGPPGLKTVWLGYQQLRNTALLFEITDLGKE